VQLRIRAPQYTGPNRCWPCTVLNVGIVLLGGAVLTTVAGVMAALPAVVVGLTAVWLRGYLVPGTPRLGRRLPQPVRSWFGTHDPVAERPAADALVAAGVLDTDLVLTPEANATIQARASSYVDDREALETAALTEFDATTVSVNRRLGGGERWFVLDDSERTVCQWGARPVAALDVAGAAYLDDRLPDWDGRGERERSTMLALLRYGTPNCPDCGAAFESTERDVTCCGGRSLAGARRCAECDYALVDRNDLPAQTVEKTPENQGESPQAGVGE
jgi:hypothetical protein